MEVLIYSRKQMNCLIKERLFPQNAAVISFCDSGTKPRDRVNYSGVCDRVMYIELDDLWLDDLAEEGYTYETFFPEASEAAEFIAGSYKSGVTYLICQCEHGESRSAGCAAAINEYFFHSGILVFQDFDYYPSKLVYHKIFDALRDRAN